MSEIRTNPTVVPTAWPVSEADRLRIACQAASIGVWQWDPMAQEMHHSSTARSISGFGPSEPITFEMVRAVTHPDDYPTTIVQFERALNPAIREQSEYRYRIIRADTGEVRWVKAYGEAKFAVVDGAERAVIYIGSIQDITAEKQREDALVESEARLRLAIDVGRMAVWELDVETDTVIGSPELNRLCGFPEDSSPSAEDLRSRYAPGERERLEAEGQAAAARGETKMQSEIKHIWPDGTEKWLLMRAQVAPNQTGAGMRVIGALVDITDEKKQEERLATVARELRHRLLNTISIISSLASRSWPSGFPEQKKEFQTRLNAIGKATNLMFSREHQSETVTLKDLLHEITEVYRSPSDNPFVFKGPDVDVAKHLRPLAMGFHELGTNALKHGALSVPEGQVKVWWEAQPDGALQITWQEMQGPKVEAPQSIGLGTTLLTKLLFNHPNSVSLDYHSDGLRCSIVLKD